jgi:hypothetical protein
VTPLQADVKELHAQVSRMQIEVGAVQASAYNASAQAVAARADAEKARSDVQHAFELVNKVDVLESLFRPTGMTANLDGKAFKWIKIAEPLLATQVLLDKYDTVIVVTEDDTTVYVHATARQIMTSRALGGPGHYVEISKKALRILQEYYNRG